MSKTIKTKKGKTIVLLNPAEKGKKFAAELGSKYRLTNEYEVKCDKSGNPLELSKEARAYRSGYLAARKDSANCYKAQQKRGKKN